jgi:YHS domain-containing protein
MKILILLTALVGGLSTAFFTTVKNPQALTDNIRTKHFRLNAEHVAIDGYDPVSYFRSGPKQSGPQKGKSKFSYDYDGVIYHFINEDNLAEFKNNPTKYEPAWGGWCGHAMALRGEKVTINPECYKIINGKNVLFYKTLFANALTNWEKELTKTPENQLVKMGDDFWAATLKK